MALITADRVLETTSTTGTSDLTLAGAITGYRTFGSVMSNFDTCYYSLWESDNNGVPTGAWESGQGTFTTGSILQRTTIRASSNNGSIVSLAPGTKRVAMSLTAHSAVTIAGTQTLSNKTIVAPTLSGGYTEQVYNISDGISVNLNPAFGSIQLWGLGANRTAIASNFASGRSMLLGIDDGAGYTITWPTMTWTKVGGSGTAPTLNTTAKTWVLLWKVESTLYGTYLGDA